MKISIMSDVHLEFGHLEVENSASSDTLILSGDICVANKFGPNYDRFFQDCSKKWKNVLYVMGNHEHYNGDYAKSAKILRKTLSRYSNVTLLDSESIELDGILFVGGTMWTDFDAGNGPGDESVFYYIARRMNDFQCVTNSKRKLVRKVPLYKTDEFGNYLKGENGAPIFDKFTRKSYTATFSPADAYEEFVFFTNFLKNKVESAPIDQKIVVLTHHAPSKLSTHPRYRHETTMNAGYSSNLNDFIVDNPQIKLWTHGHTHEDFDYMLGSTRVVCNPRGYINYEQRADYFQIKTVEV